MSIAILFICNIVLTLKPPEEIALAIFIWWAGIVVAPLSKNYLTTIRYFALAGALIGLAYPYLGSAYPWVLRGSRLAAVYVTISAAHHRYAKNRRSLSPRELAEYVLPAGQIAGLLGVWAWGDVWRDWWLAEMCSLLTLSAAGCILTLCMRPQKLKSWPERSS